MVEENVSERITFLRTKRPVGGNICDTKMQIKVKNRDVRGQLSISGTLRGFPDESKRIKPMRVETQKIKKKER